MKKQPAKSTSFWSKRFPLVTPFVLLCGVVAIFYLAYRVTLITVPAVVLGENVLHPQHDASIVCGQEEGSNLQDPAPVLSASYAQRIQQQKPLTSNLITNASLTSVDSATDQPVGFTHSIDSDTAKYEYLQDVTDDAPFLRVTDTKPSAASAALSPAWLSEPITIARDHTYAYGFQYRSNVSIRITLEYTKEASDTLGYIRVVTLKPSNAWKNFTAHFINTDNLRSLRMIVNGTGDGRVDTRSYDMHEIPSAEMQKGVVSVTFDDGWESVEKNALPLLNKYHIPTTQYVISEVADNRVVGYMDFGALARFKKGGHEIGSHSLRHCNQTMLDTKTLQDNAVRAKQLLEQHSLGPVKSFAYPLGQYNETTQTAYAKQYSLIRTSDFGYNDRYFDETNIHSMGVLSKTTDNEFKSWLDYAKVHKLWVVVVYHRVDESGDYNVSSEQLERQLAMIAASGLEILPLSKAADLARR